MSFGPDGQLKLITTTSPGHSTLAQRRAQSSAEILGVEYVPRSGLSATALARRHGVDGALVFGETSVLLSLRGRTYSYHPSMAALRIRAFSQGRTDRMVVAMGIRLGDTVLDCTCGLASDALVASYVVGETGLVRAIEASAPLALIVSDGLRHYTSDDPATTSAMRRIVVEHADYSAVLRGEPDDAFDVVYFDPMFDVTVEESSGLDLVRLFARPGHPTKDDLVHAARVARRRVVMKDRSPGHLLRQLGFGTILESRKIFYGVIDCAEGS